MSHRGMLQAAEVARPWHQCQALASAGAKQGGVASSGTLLQSQRHCSWRLLANYWPCERFPFEGEKETEEEV